MLGITAEKLFIISLIAVFLIGPARLPAYAARLGQLVRTLRRMLDDFTRRAKDEIGPEADDIDWKKLDPRQYDPRRIVREALADTPSAAPTPTLITPTRPHPTLEPSTAGTGTAGTVSTSTTDR